MKDPKAPRDPENPWEPEDPAFSRIFEDQWAGSEQGGMAGMNEREQEELLLMSGNRKERKAIKARWKPYEQAQKQSKSDTAAPPAEASKPPRR